MYTNPNLMMDMLSTIFETLGQHTQNQGLQTQQEPVLPPEGPTPENPGNMAVPGFELVDGTGQLSPEQKSKMDAMKQEWRQKQMGHLGDMPAEYSDSEPAPLEPSTQATLQPEVLEPQETSGKLTAPPAEMEPIQRKIPPHRVRGLSQDDLMAIIVPDDRELSSDDESVYKQISQKLLDELNNDKVNWGEAMGLAAVAYDNPQLAYQLLESKQNRKEHIKSLLMQAAGQEVALKRGEQAAERQSARQEAIARENELKSIRLSGSQERARAEQAGVDISDIDLSNPETFYDNLPKAQSRIALGAQFKELKKFAGQNDIPLDGIDVSKPTPEALAALQGRVDEYQKDIQSYNSAMKIAQSSPTGITSQLIDTVTSKIKSPQLQLEARAALEAAMEEGKLRRAQLRATQENIESQIQAREEANALKRVREERLNSIREETDAARTLKDADLVLDRAADNLRSARQAFEYYQSPGTEAGVIEAQEAYDKAKRRQQALLKESNPAFGREEETFDSLYQSYKYPNPNKPDEPNEWGMSGEEFDKFIFNPSNQDDPVWSEIFESMWRDFDAANNDLGDPSRFITEFNSKAGAWAAQTTESNRFFRQKNLNLPTAAINQNWMTNPGISGTPQPTPTPAPAPAP